MFLPPNMTEFICSKASCAASGTSYSTNAKPCRERKDKFWSDCGEGGKNKLLRHINQLNMYAEYERFHALCLSVTESQDMSMLLIGPKGAKACLMVSSPSS